MSEDAPRTDPYNAKAQGVRPRYTREVQIMLDQKTPEIEWTDLTDTTRFTCTHPSPHTKAPLQDHDVDDDDAQYNAKDKDGNMVSPKSRPINEHPALDFRSPHGRVHVKLIDFTNDRVQWDQYFNLNGYNRLAPNAKPLPSSRVPFWTICPDADLPSQQNNEAHPQWYQLLVYDASTMKEDPERDFIGGATFHSYQNIDDPEQTAFSWKALDGIRSVSESLQSTLANFDAKVRNINPSVPEKPTMKIQPLIELTPITY
eukprot:GEMP01049497.1.p1 GENE.GEMP01049497.1~~GEMP01049497.1.p1  ORF type:complete len:258 (+),score=42.08 GEMP01049497.1:282-1055(+)